MSRKSGHHPHFAGVKHAGIAVGEKAKRSGPMPGQTEFSAGEEKAMRAGAPDSAFPQAPQPQGNGGAPSMGGAPVPQDLDQDGGI